MPRTATSPASLLADPDVRRWHENLARGSNSTADINARRLAAFCDSVRLTPKQLLRLSEKELHDRFLDFVAAEERRGVAGSYIVRSVKGAKSWLLHNGIKLSRPIKVKAAKETPRLSDERVPTQEELRAILLAGTPRIRVACALIAFSGVRPEVLGNYLGTDGLTLGDLPEMKLEKGSVSFASTPTVVRVRPSLSKNASGYLTFLSTEGCEYLRQYLEDRLRSGEKLGGDSDLIHPDRAGKKFIRTINIGDAIRTAIRGAGFPWRPYVLRHYFDTQLLTAESKGKVARDFRVYWMGHVGSIDARYTTNKRQIPKELLEEMRTSYRRAEPYLSTLPTKGEGNEGVNKVLKALLSARGMPQEELDRLDLGEKSEEELKAIFGRFLSGSASRPSQRAVPVSDVGRLLEQGWEFVSRLDEHQAVMRSPAGPEVLH
ncbi:MAG TPA: site-specific integrase [Thermoplasmata archaeon]|nr:site-specific integrase [Thermoplasmata archaeon]